VILPSFDMSSVTKYLSKNFSVKDEYSYSGSYSLSGSESASWIMSPSSSSFGALSFLVTCFSESYASPPSSSCSACLTGSSISPSMSESTLLFLTEKQKQSLMY
jgi:hypothetical protein